MDPLLIISPHLDDAVLSCGQLMHGRPDCRVVTVFAGTPRGLVKTEYDRNCGFRDAAQAMRARKVEDKHAMSCLLAEPPIHLPYLDHQYRGPGDDWRADALSDLSRLIERVNVVIGPLGLAHPDHELVALLYGEALLQNPQVEGWVYEDMPNRVLLPETVAGAFDRWWGWGFDLGLDFLGTGDLTAKEWALTSYASQLWALDRHAVLVPERHHRLTRRTT